MLRAIEEAGPSGLPTRKVSEDVFNSRQYGFRVLKRAEEMGYIERKPVPKPKGRGGYPYIMNCLTDKGRRLLKEMEGVT